MVLAPYIIHELTTFWVYIVMVSVKVLPPILWSEGSPGHFQRPVAFSERVHFELERAAFLVVWAAELGDWHADQALFPLDLYL